MSDENFSVEESAALLHAIFPNYPDTYEMKPVPEIGGFLRGLRVGDPSKTDPVGQKPADRQGWGS